MWHVKVKVPTYKLLRLLFAELLISSSFNDHTYLRRINLFNFYVYEIKLRVTYIETVPEQVCL